MHYSFVGIVGFVSVLLINFDILFRRNEQLESHQAMKAYRLVVISFLLYLLSDLLWGYLDPLENKIPVIIDTSFYFLFMASSILAWNRYVARFLSAKGIGKFVLDIAGYAFALAGVVLVIINFFSPVLFSYGDQSYVEEIGRNVYLLSQVGLYLITSVVTILGCMHKKWEYRNRHLSIAIFGIVMAATISMQYFFPFYPLYGVGCTIGLIILRAYVISDEVSSYQEMIDKAEVLAYTDSLTGVKNKHAFVELESQYDVLIREGQAGEFALLLFDLNDLKAINDTFGHAEGDHYILKSVEQIKSFFPDTDIYRYGGDEFILLITGELYQKRYELFTAFNKSVESNIGTSSPIVALGLSDFLPGKDNAIRSVFARADERMYARKKMLKGLVASDKAEGGQHKNAFNVDMRMEMYELFYRSENMSLIDLLNASSSDEIIGVDLKNDTFKQFYHVQGKYYVPNVGMSYCELVEFTYTHIVHPDDREIYMQLMDPNGFLERLAVARIPNFNFAHFRYKLMDGDYRYVEQIVIAGEENGIPDGMFRMYVIDIDNLKSRQLGRVSDESSVVSVGHDPITGLLTGREFFEAAERIIASDKEKPWCLASVDIEHFKFFDEWFGREKGDFLLAKLGAILDEIAKDNGGVAGYFGQDDFTILLENDKNIIAIIYDRFHECIASCGLTAGFLPAIGVAPIEKDMVLVDAFDRTTIAAQEAKQPYRDRIVFYDSSMEFAAEEEYRILTESIRALQHGEIVFYLQPQCRMSTGKIVSAEALARWVKPDGTIVDPGSFVPVLEKYGFIIDLDKHIWEEVCKGIRQWIDRGHIAIPISLNVSRIDLFNMDIPAYFHALCEKYDIPHNLIKIEITESAYVQTTEMMDELVNKLMDDGFLVIMDDFGSGYSSLNMLSNLKLDAIKLDCRFLHLDEKAKQRGIRVLESVVNMVKTMSLPIIIEGVETKQQCDFLADLGCRYAQGFYFYKPMSQEDFEKVIQTPNAIDTRGIILKANEQFRMQEFLDKNIYSDSMLNTILGPVAIYAWDEEKGKVDIVRYNQQFYQAANVQNFADRIISIESFLAEEDCPKLYQAFSEAMKNRLAGSTGILRFFRPDGTLASFRIRFYYLGRKEGRERFYGSATDVTDLTDLQQMKQLIAEYSKDNITFVARRDGKWVYTVVSHGLSDIFGLSPAEFEEEMNNGAFAKRITSQKDLKRFMAEAERFAAAKQDYVHSFSFYDNNRKRIMIEGTFTYVGDQADNVLYIIRTRIIDQIDK